MIDNVHAVLSGPIDLVLAVHVALCEVRIEGIERRFPKVVELIQEIWNGFLIGTVI